MAKKMSKEKVIMEAKREHETELASVYKIQYKQLLKRLSDSKKITSNIEREIEDLELKMDHEL